MGSLDAISKFKRLQVPIRRWNKQIFGNIDFNIDKLEKAVVDLESKIETNGQDKVHLAQLKALRSVVLKWYERKYSYWKQMLKERYIKDMDRNTKFFHGVASVKKRRKLMLEIRRGRRDFCDPIIIKT